MDFIVDIVFVVDMVLLVAMNVAMKWWIVAMNFIALFS